MERILLLTGASSEVGQHLLRNIYTEYSHIYLQYRHMNDELKALVAEISREISVTEYVCDFENINDLQKMVEEMKSLKICPNNIVHIPAPKVYNSFFHKDTWENYEKGWEISVRSIVEILRALLPNMAKDGYGRVVFLLTSYTVNLPAKYLASYVTVKYALLGLMKALSVEYISKGITVNGVSPDMMETKFLSELPRIMVATYAEKSPIGRNVYVDEVIPIIKYMLSDLGAAMTGQNVAVTGGL